MSEILWVRDPRKGRLAIIPRPSLNPERGASLRRTLPIYLLIAVATIAVYSPVSHYPFLIYDDLAYVVNNSHIKSGLDWGIFSWAFTSFYQFNWHPLTWLSHALDVQIFQMDPGSHHDTNLLLHVLNVFVLFWVLERATGYVGRSAMVAALFALHPINVESVAWIAERKNLLSMLFFLLALGAYRRYVLAPRVGRYIMVALWFAMGLMAKPQIITLPFVLLLWDYWPLRRMAVGGPDIPSRRLTPVRGFSWLVKEKLPLFIIAAASAIVTVLAQTKGGAAGSLEYFPLPLRLENAIVSYVRYVGKAFWPTRLAPLYPYPLSSFPLWQIITAFLFLLVVSALVIAARKRYPYLLVGWLWFLGTLIPMIGLMQVGIQAMADRYAYLSFVGLFIMVCWGVADLQSLEHRDPVKRRLVISTVVLRAVSIAVLLILAVLTYQQVKYWSGDTALWSRTLQVTTSNFLAEDSLALSLMDQGQSAEAMKHFQTAVSIYSADPISNLQIASYDHQHGKLPEALDRYTRMTSFVRDNVSKSDIFSERAFVYFDLRQYGHAREDFSAAVAMDPRNSRAWLGLGILAHKSGDLSLAIQDYNRSAEIHPSDITYVLLARALQQGGHKDQAQAAIDRAKLFSNNLDGSRIVADGLLAH